MNRDHLPANWIKIVNESDLEDAIRISQDQPVFIFKHSTRCGISAHALYELEKWNEEYSEKVRVFFLDLLSYRPISNSIASNFKVPHQSPQLIGLMNGEAVHSISHSSINHADLNVFYRKMLPLTESH
ncbi:MAG: bacillithiol system redox-active protein YtxJ [Saprospirales bacterium]|nr:MAG: bacillithiol system redox-active protein YtxJ [Saprospirales bacterium]